MLYCEVLTMEFLLQEAFAVVREASKRVLGLRPFDVQLIGKLSTPHFLCAFSSYE